MAGYRIDIGIRHPDKPGSYLLGVECDGASYHSSKVARDRDRLRQQVLEGLGWTIHSVWSTAWFANRSNEEDRLRASIAQALNTMHQPARRSQRPSLEIEFVETHLDARPAWARDYAEPQAIAGPSIRSEFHEPGSQGLISRQIREIVRNYGPIHKEAVLRAIREEWGLKRSGQRMRNAFDQALKRLARDQSIRVGGDYLRVTNQRAEIRVPAGPEVPRREVREVPPGERKRAIFRLLQDAGPSHPSGLRQAWARLYGWARVGPDIELAFKKTVKGLVADGRVRYDDQGRLVALPDEA